MIIAITANGDSLDARVCPSIARCQNFVFYDTDLEDIVDAADNPEREILDGGSLEAAEVIVGHDTEILITGDVDPAAGDILGAGGVQVQICTGGTVKSAIERCLAGELELTSGPNRGFYPGLGSPETPHTRETEGGVNHANDPGREETDAEVVGVEEECMCLMCGYTMPHEAGSPACEVTPCPRCGANMARNLRAA
jgi:predicted Fe-Mo cluster-binding NifX family protein